MENIIDSKVCTKCNTLKKLIEFRIQKEGKYGRRASCIICDDNRREQYFTLNPHKKEEAIKRKKDYAIKNQELLKKKAKEKYYKTRTLKLDPNRVKVKDRYKEYNNENAKNGEN